jgi:hypothetical protein
LVLGVVYAGVVDVAVAVDRRRREEDARLDRQWREKLARLEYECTLARRRYELVEPDQRLVARSLETAWNERLTALEAARAEYARRAPPPPAASTPAQMRAMLAELRQVWHGGTLAAQDKKELLRCVIEQVELATDGPVVRAEVVWQGGARSPLDVPKYLGASSAAYYRARALARTHTDAAIAAALNAEGLPTMKGKPWTARRVLDFRRSNAILSGLTASPTMRLPDAGYRTSAEVAAALGVDQTRLHKWFRCGVLAGTQDAAQRQLWIAWTAEVAERLGGGAAIDAGMISVKRLCAERGKRPDDVLAWAAAAGHAIYRVRRGTAWRFYIRPRAA